MEPELAIDAQSETSERTLTDDQLLDVIRSASDGGTDIIPSQYTDQTLSPEYDLSNIPQEQHRRVKRYLDDLRTYALSPTQADHFPNHDARGAWQTTTLKKIFDISGEADATRLAEIIDNNRFSGNRVAYAHQAVNNLPRFGIALPQEESRLITEKAVKMVEMQGSGEWNRASNEERMKLTDEIAKNAASIVNSFVKPGWRLQGE